MKRVWGGCVAGVASRAEFTPLNQLGELFFFFLSLPCSHDSLQLLAGELTLGILPESPNCYISKKNPGIFASWQVV